MGTRGLLGIRNNKRLLIGRYNSMDSYYLHLGKKVINYYFNGSGFDILDLTENEEDEREFLQDGLFCEYAYIYNSDNDTLEIYRGFFRKRQAFDNKRKILNALKDNKGKEKYYCHLIIVIDRTKHTREQILKAFEEYSKTFEGEDEFEEINPYPERKIIPIKIPKDYILLV